MYGINQARYTGTLITKPELKYTPGGLAILELTIAGKVRVITEEGEIKEPSFYNRCKAYGRYAETIAESFDAGDVVSAFGKLDYSSWENPEGEKRSAIDTKLLTLNRIEGNYQTTEDAKGQAVLLEALNEVTVAGNLTRDAEIRHTPGGDAVTRFSLAVNDSYRDRDGKEQEKVLFVDINAWRTLAETAGTLAKGQPVIVTGRLTNESWTDKDGNRRYAERIEALRLEVVSRGEASSKPTPAKKARQPVLTGEKGSYDFQPEEDLPF